MKKALSLIALLLIVCMIIPLASCKEVLPTSGEALTSSPGDTPSSREPQSSVETADDGEDTSNKKGNLNEADYQVAYRQIQRLYENGERISDFDEKIAAMKIIIPDQNVDLAVTDYEKALENAPAVTEEEKETEEDQGDQAYETAMDVLLCFYEEKETKPDSFEKKLSSLKKILDPETVDLALANMDGTLPTEAPSGCPYRLTNNIIRRYLYEDTCWRVEGYLEKLQALTVLFESDYVTMKAEEIDYDMAELREFGACFDAYELLDRYIYAVNNSAETRNAKLEALKILYSEAEVEDAQRYHKKVNDPYKPPRVTLGC